MNRSKHLVLESVHVGQAFSCDIVALSSFREQGSHVLSPPPLFPSERVPEGSWSGSNRLVCPMVCLFNILFGFSIRVQSFHERQLPRECVKSVILHHLWRMSYRRVLNCSKFIPKRGLEEFLDSSKVIGKDTVYGI